MFYLPFKLQKEGVKNKIKFLSFFTGVPFKIKSGLLKKKKYFPISIITATFLFLCKVGQKINFAYTPSLTALGLVFLPRFRMDLCAALITYVSQGVMAILLLALSVQYRMRLRKKKNISLQMMLTCSQ